MNSRLTIMIMGALLMPVAHAQPPANVQIEVKVLLDFVGGSRCEFYRNGTWSDSKSAQTHLRAKYEYLAARNLIDTTEDFIEKAAAKSSLSGQPYEVSCNGGATVKNKKWLHDELARIRGF